MALLLLIGYLAGVATVLSPCILPVLPIILSGVVGGKSRPYGIIVGFIFSFSIFTVFATWLVKSLGLDIDVLRNIAALVLALLGLSLIFPKLQEKINSFIKLPQSKQNSRGGFVGGLATGATLGLVWAPCAGPILAAVITLAATAQAGIGSFLIVLSYAAGTGTVMLLILLGSRRVLEKVKKLYAYLEIIHKVFGVLIIVAALGIYSGYDRKVQSYIIEATPEGLTTFLQSFEDTSMVRDAIDNLSNKDNNSKEINMNNNGKSVAPELVGIEAWINSEPLTLEELKGRVVLIDFWTYSCINCIRTLPYLKDWYEKYEDDGLVIIGVHAPEFPFEKKYENVVKAVREHGLKYPIALDNNFETWQNYNNRYWPAKYFIDREGNVRHHHYGEGDYDGSEAVIQALLAEGGQAPKEKISPDVELNFNSGQTPETYLGYWRLANFKNQKDIAKDKIKNYSLSSDLSEDQWSIGGDWNITEKVLESAGNDSKLIFNFSAKDVFLVMGSDTTSNVKVYLNGVLIEPSSQGADVNANAEILVNDYRLYRVVEAESFIKEGLLELIFPAGVEAHAFTFGS